MSAAKGPDRQGWPCACGCLQVVTPYAGSGDRVKLYATIACGNRARARQAIARKAAEKREPVDHGTPCGKAHPVTLPCRECLEVVRELDRVYYSKAPRRASCRWCGPDRPVVTRENSFSYEIGECAACERTAMRSGRLASGRPKRATTFVRVAHPKGVA